jgi:hypothetical protein
MRRRPGHDGRVDRPGSSRSSGRLLRVVVVVDDLADLRGPLTGEHRLPRHLDSSARHLYDFGDPKWRELAYRTVLMEAGTVTDVADWLDRDVLLAIWPELYLPPLVREAWQRRHPDLASAGTSPLVPSPP